MIDEGLGNLQADAVGVADPRLLSSCENEVPQRVISLFRLLKFSLLVPLDLSEQLIERRLCRGLPVLVIFLNSSCANCHGDQEGIARFLFRFLLDAFDQN